MNGRHQAVIAAQPSIQSGTLFVQQYWEGAENEVAYDPTEIKRLLFQVDQAFFVVRDGDRVGFVPQVKVDSNGSNPSHRLQVIGTVPAIPIESLGSSSFCTDYGMSYAYYGGSMANGISSEAMVIALGEAGMLGSYGAAGMVSPRVEAAIERIQAALPGKPYAFNLINSPNEPRMEERAAALYVKHGIHLVEASAYLDITHALAYYRAAGLSQDEDGRIVIGNRIIAKLSRKEVARRFMEPAPDDLLNQLVSEGLITAQQAELARQVPMADDITVEADSGGHTDNRPLVCLLPTMLALRDEIMAERKYAKPVRIGAAGGISTPASALAALMMGADFIATGSVNQACMESGASEHTKNLLAQADMADVMMAPAADMFEMGVKVQLLKRGTLFPMRAQKLYELYSRYNSLDEIPQDEREKIEKTVFKREFNAVWDDTVKFFTERDPSQIERANRDPHQKMALVFRWYLGLSSRWSAIGEKGRELDYQIWCGPSMGTFNDWTRGTYLQEPKNRHVVDVALHILTGVSYLYRIQMLKMQGIQLSHELETYTPSAPLA